MAQDPDYLNLEIPKNKDPKEFTWAERRAEEIEYIKRYGDPQLVPKTELANRYGVTTSQICQDFDRVLAYLNEYGAEHTSRRVKVFLDNLFDEIVKEKRFRTTEDGRRVRKKMTDKELEELYAFVRTHASWMMDLGRIERETQQVEGDFNLTISKQVIDDED